MKMDRDAEFARRRENVGSLQENILLRTEIEVLEAFVGMDEAYVAGPADLRAQRWAESRLLEWSC